jgi:hypothetical protein
MVPLSDTATRLRAGTKAEGYGGSATEPDWSDVGRDPDVDLPCLIQPRSSFDVTLDRETTVGQWVGIFGSAADLRSTDRLSWRGRTLTVDGDVAPIVLRGVTHHLEVPLREITGTLP